MELNKGFEPQFTIDSQIEALEEKLSNHDIYMQDLEKIYVEKKSELEEKIQRLHALLMEEQNKFIGKRQKARIQFAADRTQLDALKKEKKQQAEKESIEKVINLVKEIAQDLEAFTVAREYQVEDIVQIVQQYMAGSSGILNANEMALGKTFETLVALFIIIKLHEKKHGKPPTMLWLTKKSLIDTGSTKAEATRWFPDLKIYPIAGAENKATLDLVFKLSQKGGICVLTNYETIKKINRKDWDILITDEVHKLKGGANAKPTDIWKAAKELRVGFHIMLSGTPLVNRVEEMWSYLHLFDPHAFPNSKQFTSAFRAFRNMAGELKLDIHSETLLRDILKGRLIRRTAKEVGLQMPPVQTIDRWLTHNSEQGKYYEQARDKFLIWLEKQDGDKVFPITSILARLIRLRQINVLPVAKFKNYDEEGNWDGSYEYLDCRDSSKIDEMVDIVMDTNDQCLVFSNFKEPLEEGAKRIREFGFRCEIISSDYADKMSTYEEDFQQGKIAVLFINMAMGEGLNLHKDSEKWPGGARAVILLDKWYNPARNNQAIARAVRPGKNTGEPVFVYDLKVENSIDLWLDLMIKEKADKFDLFTENQVSRPARELKELLRKLL